jgi:predicted porin
VSNAIAPSIAREKGTRHRPRNAALRAAIVLGALGGASGVALAADGGPTADGPLTWNGITLYGILDAGLQYQSHGVPISDYFPAATETIIQKNSNGPQYSINGNSLSQSRIGLKGAEDFGNGWSGIFRLETFFNPWSGQLSDALKSVTANNGVALTSQNTGVDSSIAGQLFGGAAYMGVSHAQFGTLTFGRQNGILADGIAKYDPLKASQAFSPIGWSGTAAGSGNTEDRRLDGSLKYEVTTGPVHIAAQFQPKTGANPGTTGEFALGWLFPGGSIDAYYVQKNDAIAAGSLSAAQVTSVGQVCAGTASVATAAAFSCAAVDKAVTGTISDTTSYGVMGNWSFANKAATLSAGFESIDYKNPSNIVKHGQITIGGYVLATTNNAAFPSTKTLKISWIGLKYAVSPQADITGAFYRYSQNSYSTASPGCSDAAISAQCSGSENFASVVFDYHFTKRFDGYLGGMWSSISGGLANGFLNTSTIDPTVGFRYQF